MQTYNYLANEQPRELIELYNDIQADILRIIVRELKKGTRPENVYQKIRDTVDEYKPLTEKVVTIIFADSENKTIKDNKKIVDKEPSEEREALDKGQTDSIFAPLVAGALAFISSLNDKLTMGAVNKYYNSYIQANTPQITRFKGGLDNLERVYRDLANNGLSIYESFGGGKAKNYSVENIIRRDVMSLVNKANAKADMANFKNSSAKFIEVSSHPTARTWNKYMKEPYEDHSSWQGKVYYSRDGEYVDGYEEFESTCGYGETLGIRGINCYHTFQMNYTGESSATEYSQKEVEKNYELSQQQRAYERAIRQLKQARAVYEEAGETQLTKQIGTNISNVTKQLKDFCEKNDLKYYNWRTQI